MKKLYILLVYLAAILLLLSSCVEENFTGVVFYDVDNDSLYTANDIPIPDVQVSDGLNIVITNEKGIFKLPKSDAEFIYITKPSGYDLPLERNCIPVFYKKVEESTEIYNFILRSSSIVDDFTAIIMNDIHLEVNLGEGGWCPNQDPVETFNEYIDEFISLDPRPDFFISVGDQSGVWPDNTERLEEYVIACSRLGVPVYNAMGNPGHNDSDLDRVFFKNAYRSYFGPLYYSFDYGNYHFIVLDTNIIWGDHGKNLAFGLDEKQYEWFMKDLELNKEKCLLVFYHEPIDNTENQLEYWFKVMAGKKPDVWLEKEKVLALLDAYNVAATFAGHTHTNGLYEEAGTIFVTNGAVCGAWWGPKFNGFMYPFYPEYEENEINAGPDGTPQGYRILSAYPTLFSTSYKAFRDEARITFANPTSTYIGSGKLSFTDLDMINFYTFCINVAKNGDPISTSTFAMKPLRGVIPLLLNAYSIYPIQKVEYRIDIGEWSEAEQIGGLMWNSQIETSDLMPGLHVITARLVDDQGEYSSQMAIIVGL
ncbi:MAG: metallophosphoesterase [Deltaproteobacteria bacterium]|nr:metallophosphoesterase [Deltaproteobacteria bacterium]